MAKRKSPAQRNPRRQKAAKVDPRNLADLTQDDNESQERFVDNAPEIEEEDPGLSDEGNPEHSDDDDNPPLPKLKPLTLSELQSAIAQEARDSIAYLGGNSRIAQQRSRALQYYFRETVGNLSIDDENRSKVVSSDVAETVEWILPSLLRIFMSGDQVVIFEPQGPEDEQTAKEATEYANWIFMRDNPGFLILYTNFKDALLQKNGVGKVWWEVKETDNTREVKGIDDGAYTLLVADPNVDILEHAEYPDPSSASPVSPQADGSATPASPASPVDVASNPMQATYLHDVKYKTNNSKGTCCIAAVPPEEFLISRDAKAIDSTAFCGHLTTRMISDLIAEGYDPNQVREIPSDDANWWGLEAQVRRDTDEVNSYPDNRTGVRRKVSVLEAYILADMDGDGIAERRKVVCGGPGFTVLNKWNDDSNTYEPDNILWEGPPPFYSLTPIIQPHKFFGVSIAELVMDLQDIKTALLRGSLDNLYLTNMPGVIASQKVNLDDLLDRRPGRVVRMTDANAKPGDGHIVPEDIPFTAAQSFQMLEYIDTERAERTGVTKYTQGLDANSLNKTATGINQITNAAQQRVELIARIFAETGVKDLFRLIMHNITKYQDKARIVRLNGQWTSIDPNQWDTEFDMSINVGLGTGNKDQMLIHLQQIYGMQVQAVQFQLQSGTGLQGPFVNGENIYNTAAKIVENSGLKSPEQFFMDPKNSPPMQPQQPKPDPEMIKVQQQGQLEQQKFQLEAWKAQQQHQLDTAKLQGEFQLKQHDQMTNHAMKQEQINASQKPVANVNVDANGQLQGVADAMTQLAANQQQFMEQQSTAMTQALMAIGQAAQIMAQAASTMSAPKKITRDQNGKAIGVEPVSMQ